MMRARPHLLLLVAPLVLLAACGGDGGDDGDAADTEAPVATEAPADAPTESAADDVAATVAVDPTVPAGGGEAPMGLMVLDAMTLTFDAPAPVVGSITRSGLAAADPMSVDVRCMLAGSYLEVVYTATTPGEMPVEFFTLTADGVEGPGTYTASITLSAPDAPAGSMPFTEVTGKESQLTVTGDLAGSFSVDDGFGNPITGSYSCTQAPMPMP